jgi:hypothetical protein
MAEHGYIGYENLFVTASDAIINTHPTDFDHADWKGAAQRVSNVVTDSNVGAHESIRQSFSNADLSVEWMAVAEVVKDVSATSVFSILRILFYGNVNESHDVVIDASNGDIRHKSHAAAADVSVVDNGDYYTVSVKGLNSDPLNTGISIYFFPAGGALPLTGGNLTSSTNSVTLRRLELKIAEPVTASGAVVGFEAVNAIDWKQYDWWKQGSIGYANISVVFPTAQSADYMCVFGHNLSDVDSTVKAQYSTNGGSTWANPHTVITPTDAGVVFVKFNSVSAADWRVLVHSATGKTIIAGVMIGTITNLNRDVTNGFAPANLSPIVETKTPMSERGVNLGTAVIREGLKGNIQLNNVDEQWVRDEWTPLVEHLNLGRPAVFVWDAINRPEDAILIWKNGQIPAPKYSSNNLMSVSLAYDGKK